MKIKILAIATLGLLSVLSVGRNFTNAHADLDAPEYDYAYKQDISDYWRVHNAVSNGYDNAIYTRSGSSSPYDYTVTTSVELPFQVKMTFRSSNEPTWTSSGGGYRPGESFDDAIGSTSANVVVKVEFEFNNNTGYTYLLQIDMETAASVYLEYTETFTSNTITYTRTSGTGFYYAVVPAYTYLKWYTPSSSSTRLFNAWYLTQFDSQFVAPNDQTYQEGFNDGYDDGFIDGQDSAESNVLSRMSVLMNTLFGGLGGILDIKIFDELSLGSLMLFPLAMSLLFFIFKLIRGSK